MNQKAKKELKGKEQDLKMFQELSECEVRDVFPTCQVKVSRLVRISAPSAASVFGVVRSGHFAVPAEWCVPDAWPEHMPGYQT